MNKRNCSYRLDYQEVKYLVNGKLSKGAICLCYLLIALLKLVANKGRKLPASVEEI